jgi:hypothetical protein
VAAAGALVALAVAASAAAANAYCSPSGDFCTSAARQGGAVFLQLRTFSLRGAIRICVVDPRPRQACRRFRLRPRRAGVYEVKVRWHRHFPNGGKGPYRVRFLVGTTQLGPVLTFRLR